MTTSSRTTRSQQPSPNKSTQANKQTQSSANRSRIFRRFRNDPQPARNSASKSPSKQSPSLQGSQETQPATQGAGNSALARRPALPQVPTLAPPLAPVRPQGNDSTSNEISVEQGHENTEEMLRSVMPSPTDSARDAQESSSANRWQLGLELKTTNGQVEVADILPGSSAQADGLRVNDIIESIAGVPVQNTNDFYQVVELMQSGDKVEVVVKQLEEESTLLLTIGGLPEHGKMDNQSGLNQENSEAAQSIQISSQDSIELSESLASASELDGLALNDSESALDLALPMNERLLQEEIREKELEITELTRQLQALKRRLAAARQSDSF